MSLKDILEEESKKPKGKEPYVLRLYVAGISPRSQKAIDNLKKLCEEYDINYVLEVIDIYQNPIIARNGQIVAAPTLVKELPLPIRKFVGDMSDKSKLILGLDLHAGEDDKKE